MNEQKCCDKCKTIEKGKEKCSDKYCSCHYTSKTKRNECKNEKHNVHH